MKTYNNSIYTRIDSGVSKSLWTYFNRVNIKSDNGIHFSTEKKFDASKYERVSFDMVVNSDHLVEYGLMTSFNQEIIYHSYITIQDICADI